MKFVLRAAGTIDHKRDIRRDWYAGAMLIAVTFVAYLPALSAGFIWDDSNHVLHTGEQTSSRGLADLWNPRLHLMPQYYPVTHTSFWIEHHLWGNRPAGYHAV